MGEAPDPIRPGEEMLTVEQAAKRANCGRTRMYERVLSGEVESVKVGRLRRIPESALERWFARLLDEQATLQRKARTP